jgi:hypothetical protein
MTPACDLIRTTVSIEVWKVCGVLRRVWLLVAAMALVLSGLAVVPTYADDWIPPSGAAFNMPRGGVKARTKLVRRVIAAINHAPKDSTIRFAMYSFDRRDVANALLRAHRRGVNVQLIVNDNWTSAQTRRLRRAFGTKPRRSSFYVICRGSCRGGKGNLHMKVYSFSRTGGATKVLMTGSGNLTDRAVSLQWNDQVTLLDSPGLYDLFVKVFRQLKFDRRVSPRRVAYAGTDTVDALFYRAVAEPTSTINSATQPRRRPRPADDPVLKRLRAVDCAAAPGYGNKGRTRIRIMMYAWMRSRSYLADRVAYLKRQGCDIRVITSVSSSRVVRIIKAAGIPTRSADYDLVENAEGELVVNFYSHLKVMALDGTYGGQSVRTVWTGSENWSGISFMNDELILHLTGDKVHAKYVNHFDLLWKRYTHPHRGR